MHNTPTHHPLRHGFTLVEPQQSEVPAGAGIHLRQAFTLVELSIVLCIVALIAGGIVMGQSLVRGAEMRAVTTEYQRFDTALVNFRDKFGALPGDMPNAVSYWGAQTGSTADGRDAGCMALTYTTPSTDSKTCNGDGNGFIGGGSVVNVYELFRAWQQLANAGFIEGPFTGVAYTAGTNHALPGWNSPRTKIGNGGWTVYGTGYITGSSSMFTANYGGAAFWIGGTLANNSAAGPILKPEEAYNVDKKLDDGYPDRGTVLATKNAEFYTPNCVVATNDAYDLTQTTLQCRLYFITGF